MASHGAAVGLLIGLWLFFAPEQTALHLVARPHHDPCGDRRCGGAFRQSVQFGDRRQCNRYAVGLQVRASLPRPAARRGSRAKHPTQLYEALCYVATFGVLWWLYYRRDTGVRRPGLLFGVGLIGVFLTRFFHRVHQGGSGGLRAGNAAQHGAVVEYPLHPFRNLYDLAGVVAPCRRGEARFARP